MRWTGHVACIGKKRDAYGFLVGKSKGRRPLRRFKGRWKDNIKIDVREIQWGGVDWVHLAQDRDQWPALVHTEINLRLE
jgi:hypothetical protein